MIASNVISNVLLVPKFYYYTLTSTNSDRAIILVHKSWLSSLLATNTIPKFIYHDTLSQEEVEAGLLLKHPFSSNWERVLVQVLTKPNSSDRALALPRHRNTHASDDLGLCYPQLLHYISQTNYKNLWKHQYKKYLGDRKKKSRDVKKNVASKDALSVLKEALFWMYGCPLITIESHDKQFGPEVQPHPNVLPAACILETQTELLILHPLTTPTTLKDFITFSPSVFSNDLSKSMLIAYQLVQVLRSCHDKSLLIGDVRMEDIYVSLDLFIQLIPKVDVNIFGLKTDLNIIENIPRPPVDRSLAVLSRKWIIGDLSNFDYLMHLNAAAGRQFGMPSNHYILPWVSDLTTKSSGPWRDLTKSKFRLNKGDRQLDITYDHASENQMPHHVTDVLSEITYYVYLARRTPQPVLCRYVRSTWVPAEYPASIQRMYTWSPDECIPEFYTDPSIFKSIHEDLSDLELPPWAPTPENFIAVHREQLESRRVSELLHHWIDLTFGYKLTGSAAAKAKNVCLHLATSHTTLCTSGVVQVFTQPHPRRQSPIPGFDKQPPKPPKIRQSLEEEREHSSEGEEEDLTDSKTSSLRLQRFLSLSRTSLLAPFQTSVDESPTPKTNASGSGSVTTNKSGLENPMALLTAVENSFAFHYRTFGEPPSDEKPDEPLLKIKHEVADRRQKEMQTLGCLIMELFLNSQLRLQSTNSIEERITVCRRHLANENLPYAVRPCLRLLLDSNKPITDVGLPPPTAHQILQPLLFGSLIPFPSQMPALYITLCKLKNLKRFEATSEMRVKLFAEELGSVLSGKTIDLIYPYVKDLLEDPMTIVPTVNLLLDKILCYLGVRRTNELFLDTLISLYEKSPALEILYQRGFLLMLMTRCGLKTFLTNFIVFIVEAVGSTSYTPLDGVNVDEEESSPEVEERTVLPEPNQEIGMFAFDREDTPSDGESLQNLMDHLTGTSDDDDGEMPPCQDSQHGVRSPPIPVATRPGLVNELASIECEIGSKNNDPPLPTFDGSSRAYDELASLGLPVSRENESQHHYIAADSILWLARRIGPVLTAKYISRNLLKMLSLSYSGPVALSPTIIQNEGETSQWVDSVTRHKIIGDENGERVIFCLEQIVDLYGGQFILCQYLPFMSDLIAIGKRKLTYSVEGGVVGALALLKRIISLLSDGTLMDNLQDIILDNILHPLVRLMVTTRFTFPSGHLGRQALATKLVDSLYHLAVHIGAEMTRVRLAVPSLQRFFLAFDKAAGHRLNVDELEENDPRETTTRDELKKVFNPSLAYSAYMAFVRLLGENTMQNSLTNHDFIRKMCHFYEKQGDLSYKSKGTPMGSLSDSCFLDDDHGFSSSVSVIGNKIEIQDYDGPVVVANAKTYQDKTRHIRGNWHIYWEHEIGRSDKDMKFNFKQIKLQTFQGHTNAVRCLEVLDNENSLLSGSRDKTVKLWSLRNQGDGSSTSSSQFTYVGHRKSLVGVAYLSGPRLVASCDSSLHLWDPFVGQTVSVIEGKSPCTTLRIFDTLLLTGTAESTLRIVDARTPDHVAEHKISWTVGGIIRCICVSPDGAWAAVGQSSGYISVLGLRTVLAVTTWKAHEGEVLQLTTIDKNTILSSSLDQTLSVWNINDGKLKFHLKGPTEPVHCLRSYGGELISATTANRIGVHTDIDPQAVYSASKLRSDTFKGSLTSMAVLPMNMQLLLGADNGHIALLC